MSLPQEALEKLAREIESQAIAAQQQIGQTRQQTATKQREMRLARLTLNEISGLPAGSNVYEGVGKMFVALPATKMTEKLEGQVKDSEGEVEQLGKRLHYLEMTFKNSRDNIEKMFGQQSA